VTFLGDILSICVHRYRWGGQCRRRLPVL